jgi:hypothetical protein
MEEEKRSNSILLNIIDKLPPKIGIHIHRESLPNSMFEACEYCSSRMSAKIFLFIGLFVITLCFIIGLFIN